MVAAINRPIHVESNSPDPNVTTDVESVDGAAKAVADAGGQVVVPKMAIPGVGWLIYWDL